MSLHSSMVYLLTIISVVLAITLTSDCKKCNIDCPENDEEMVCGFNVKDKEYQMFPNKCAMTAFTNCSKLEINETPIEFCIKAYAIKSRRGYDDEESCPVFCAEYYRPVCGASKLRDYIYRTFINQCFLDMINCRGDEDYSGYVEVPLEYCQRHLMKNIFKEKIVMSNFRDYVDNFR